MNDGSTAAESGAGERLAALERLLGIVDRLRDPGGCPWDREQTVASMAGYAIEEAHELVEAVERGDDAASAAESGDLLMVLAMICRIASESGRFDLARAAHAVSDKLVRRHPHVFGEAEAMSSREVLQSWERIKQAEREGEGADASALAGIPLALPALQRADRACGKAVSAGFCWSNAEGALAKLREEMEELESELARCELSAAGRPAIDVGTLARVEEELGDVLLAAAFLGSYVGVDPERACRAAVRRFEERFRRMEAASGRRFSEQSQEELLDAWQAAKRRSD